MDELNQIDNILNLCIHAKEKGHDCFFQYSPHCALITIYAYRGDWKEKLDPDMTFYLYIDAKSSIHNPLEIDKAEYYLTKLVRGDAE